MNFPCDTFFAFVHNQSDNVKYQVQRLQGNPQEKIPKYLQHLPFNIVQLLSLDWPSRLWHCENKEYVDFSLYDIDAEDKHNTDFYMQHPDYILIAEGSYTRLATTHQDATMQSDFYVYEVHKFSCHGCQKYLLSQYLSLLHIHVDEPVGVLCDEQVQKLQLVAEQYANKLISLPYYEAMQTAIKSSAHHMYAINQNITEQTHL